MGSKLKKILLFGHEFLFDNNEMLIINELIKNDVTETTRSLFILCREKYAVHEIRRAESWLVQYNNMQFFLLFRMEKTTLEIVINVVGNADTKGILSKRNLGGYPPIELKLQILIFIWYMATQDSLIYIGDRFKVSHTAVMNVVNKILYFMRVLKKYYIVFPKNIEELRSIAQGFPTYPGVIGALDGTHVFIKVDKHQQDSYIDRYRRHSINIMAICDSHGLFTYAFVGFPGSAHDSRVFQNSQLFNYIEMYGPNSIFLDDNQFHLVGDSAFGLRSWLMTPYKDNNNLTRVQKHHNYCLSSARVTIEHAFGLLKGRWRRLIYINTYNICKTIEIATAALVLHNFCIRNSDIWREVYQAERIHLDRLVEVQQEGRMKRDRIAQNL